MMTHEESIAAGARLGRIIAERNPCIRYTDADVRRARYSFTEDEKKELRSIGLLGADFEQFYVIRQFLGELDIGADTDGEYILSLFRHAKRLDADAFEADPYLRTVKVGEAKQGRFQLRQMQYLRGELFFYDMPDFHERLVTPRLGFFSRAVSFPALYENSLPWVSVCPSEINSMTPDLRYARGNILVLGLGLGYYAFRAAEKAEVSSVTVVELQQTVIDLFQQHLLPQFPAAVREKIRLVRADALAYMKTVQPEQFDFCYADIWEGAVDGAPLYREIRSHEARLPGTQFAYWIEEQIKAYLDAES